MASTMLGGSTTQGAWFVLLLALAPIWYVYEDGDVDLMYHFTFLGSTTEVSGEVIDVIEGKRKSLGTTDYGMEWESVRIDGIQYKYLGDDARWHAGFAYGLKQNMHERYANVGAIVPVEYVAGKPGVSRVKGLDRTLDYKDPLLSALFWAAVVVGGIALLAVLQSLAEGLGIKNLLSKGSLAYGELKIAESLPILSAANMRKLSYAYHDGEQQQWFNVYSARCDDELLREPEPILYNPRSPKSGLVQSHIPGEVQVDANGGFTEGDSNPYHYLWIPWACTIAYGWFILHVLGISSPPGL